MLVERFLEHLAFEKRSSALTVKAYGQDLDQFRIFISENVGLERPELANDKAVRAWMMSLLEGTTGNNRFPTQCPYPGVSYCEPFAESNAKLVQGFATRMSLQDISIGLNEQVQSANGGLVAYPNPTTNEVGFFFQGLPLLSGKVRILDATGRLVTDRMITGPVLHLGELADGAYRVHVINGGGRVLGTSSLVITR